MCDCLFGLLVKQIIFWLRVDIMIVSVTFVAFTWALNRTCHTVIDSELIVITHHSQSLMRGFERQGSSVVAESVAVSSAMPNSHRNNSTDSIESWAV